MSKHVRDIFRRSQRGFTLIELVAVMAIMAILVAIVAPAVVDTRDTSVRAQAQGDAKQVNNLAAEYYGDRNEAEVRTPHTTAVSAIGVTNETVGNAASAQQEISSRWPEQFITHKTAALSAYETEFEPTASAVTVTSVTLKNKYNTILVPPTGFVGNAAQYFLSKFTAVDFVKLGGDTPSSATLDSVVTLSCPATGTVGGCTNGAGTVTVHNFLWLFVKGDSGSGLLEDVRDAAVFQLTGTEINENVGTVNLTYKQILP